MPKSAKAYGETVSRNCPTLKCMLVANSEYVLEAALR